MAKANFTISMNKDIAKRFRAICVRHGDKTWHTEKAFEAYLSKLEKAGKRDND